MLWDTGTTAAIVGCAGFSCGFGMLPMQFQLLDTGTTVAVVGCWDTVTVVGCGDYNCCCGMRGLQLLFWEARASASACRMQGQQLLLRDALGAVAIVGYCMGWWDCNCCCEMLGLQLLLWDAETTVTLLWDAEITVVVVGCG
jgi:hypothetical protein